MISQPGRALVGIAIVLLGAPAFFIWRNRLQRQQTVGAV
jgi:HAMP domain-containing protein